MITIILAVLIFGGIIFFHELGHFILAKRSRIVVEEFAIGMGPVLFKKEHNGTLYSLRLFPVGGFTAMQGEDNDDRRPGSFAAASIPARLGTLLAGSFANLLMGYLILMVLTVMSGYVGTTYIAAFNDSAVSSAVLQEGDRVLRVNGHRVSTSNDIVYELMRDRDGLLDVEVQREGERLTLPVQFALEEVEGVRMINFDFKLAAVPAAALDYVTYPVNWGISLVKQVWGSLVDLLTGRYAINQLSGPVGVVSAIDQASKIGLESVLLMAAFITINVGVFNLLPLPILDGGRVLFLAIEAVIRRPISQKVMDITMNVSVILMILLMIYVTCNDVLKLITG